MFYNRLWATTLGMILAVLLLLLGWHARALITPVISALLVAYLVNPVVRNCELFGVPPWGTVAVLVLALQKELETLHTVQEQGRQRERAKPPILPLPELGAPEEGMAAGEGDSDDPLLHKLDAVEATLAEVRREVRSRSETAAAREEPTAEAGSGGGGLGQPPTAAALTPGGAGADSETKPSEEKPRKERPRQVGASRLLEIFESIDAQLTRWGIKRTPWERERIVNWLTDNMGWLGARMLELFSSAAGKIGQFTMVFSFTLIFALIDGRNIYRSTIRLLPNAYFEPGLFIIGKTEQIFGTYLRGVAVETVILGLICYALLLPFIIATKLSLTMAFVVALIVALTNVVRIVGPIVGGAIGVLLVLFVHGDLVAAVGIAVVAGITQVLDGAVVLPLVMQGQLNIHPLVTVLGVMMGGMLGGVLGMILAIPLTAFLVVFWRLAREKYVQELV